MSEQETPESVQVQTTDQEQPVQQSITFDQFVEISSKLQVRLGTIVAADRVPKSKLLKLDVSFGEGERRIVLTNIGPMVDDTMGLVGRQFPFVTNLAPVMMKGIESQAMILLPTNESGPDLSERPANGTKLL